MPSISWVKIARVLHFDYIENVRCKLCGAEIQVGETFTKTLYNVYKHFREAHPECVEAVKKRLLQELREGNTEKSS